jgi:hypothetical protein
MKMPFEVPEKKQIRVIINLDAKCEAARSQRRVAGVVQEYYVPEHSL